MTSNTFTFDKEVLREDLIYIITTQKKVCWKSFFHFINCHRLQRCITIIKDERNSLQNLTGAGRKQIYLFDFSLKKNFNQNFIWYFIPAPLIKVNFATVSENT